MNEPVDIIIPVWNQGNLTRRCLFTIEKNTRKPFRVILVDNGSEEEEAHRWRSLLSLGTVPHLLIRNTENLGFVKAVNQGLAQATAPFVVLMNNDTEAVADWLPRLLEPFEYTKSHVGAVGPLTTTRESWQGRHPEGDGWEVLPKSAMLAFFCTAFRREVFERVGFLDEEFAVGFGDDDDYCARMHEAGFRLALRRDLRIPHHHRSTFRLRWTEEEIKAMQHKAIALFYEKRNQRRAAPRVACRDCGDLVEVSEVKNVKNGQGQCPRCSRKG